MDKLSTRSQKGLLILNRFVGCTYTLHSLRKFADVIEIVADFDVIRVDKPANTLFRHIIRKVNLNHTTVGNTGQTDVA